MMIVSGTHVQKAVVNTKDGTVTFIKGKFALPNLIIAASSQHDNPEERSVQAMISD